LSGIVWVGFFFWIRDKISGQDKKPKEISIPEQWAGQASCWHSCLGQESNTVSSSPFDLSKPTKRTGLSGWETGSPRAPSGSGSSGTRGLLAHPRSHSLSAWVQQATLPKPPAPPQLGLGRIQWLEAPALPAGDLTLGSSPLGVWARVY